MNKKISTIKLILFLLLTILLVSSATFAALMLTLNINISNGIYNYAMTCFDIDYDAGSDINGTLIPSKNHLGGLNGSVTLGIDPKCNVSAKGELFINVKGTSNTFGVSVDPHCENSITLETMKNYTTSDSCTTAGGKWITNGKALKYAIFLEDESTPLNTGYIHNSGKISIYSDFLLPPSGTNYEIYIWLDGELSDNSYSDLFFEASLNANATQLESDYIYGGTAYAIYSEDDNSLSFYSSDTPIQAGTIYNNKTATEVYSGFINKTSFSTTGIPWYQNRENITSVYVIDDIYPLSTMYWFSGFTNCSYLDLKKLNTSSVTNMSGMFQNTGSSTETFQIEGLDKFNTSKVTSMYMMFRSAGKNATEWNIGDLSEWNTASVTDMSYMFYEAAAKVSAFDIGNLDNWNTSNVTSMSYAFAVASSATTWNIGHLDNWDVSKVTNMFRMFYNAGQNATKWDIGDISGWNTQNVTGMSEMFYNAGKNSNVFNLGDLSNWNTSKVTNMNSMFSNAGRNSSEWNIGKLSNWNTSKVTDMGIMLAGAGSNASVWELDLSNWDVSNVTNMNQMFQESGYNSSDWSIGNLDNWNTSKVKNMQYMFYQAGNNSPQWNIGNISGWNVSEATNMYRMFAWAGVSASNWSLDLSSWNVSNVTNHTDFNLGVTSKIIEPEWVG